MTEDEKRQQKAMLLLEFQETELELAHLRERARQIAVDLTDVVQWLDKASGFSNSWPHVNFVASVERYRKAFDFDAVLTAVREISAAERRLTELRKRKEALGLR